MPKLSEAQHRRLMCAPDAWEKMPMYGDNRPNAPLIAKGFIEIKKRDMTPADWPMGVCLMSIKWRITDAGRAAIDAYTAGRDGR